MIRRYLDLFLIVLFSLLLVVVTPLFQVDIMRILVGLPFVLFFPGYAMVAALFPRKTGLGGLERVVLSFGMSIVVVPLIGLAIGYSPWGIRLYPVLISVTVFIIVMSIIALLRRSRLPPEERFMFAPDISSVKSLFAERGKVPSSSGSKSSNRILTTLLVLVLLGGIGAMAWAIAAPWSGDWYTEFYLLGPDGKAENYPRQVKLGESAAVRVVIENHEQKTTSYRLLVTIDNVPVSETRSITLNREERWEQPVSFKPSNPGINQKVEFNLYKNTSETPEFTLYLWVDVVK